MKSSLYYQVNVTKAKRFKKRPFTSRGVGFEAFTDTAFIAIKTDQENQSRRFIFLLAVDVHSRYMYASKIEGQVKPESLKQAFSNLFKQGMPKFPIIRCDRDPSFNKLAPTYFANHGILLRARRSVSHMIFLEGIIRSVKRKFVQNLRKKNPEVDGQTKN